MLPSSCIKDNGYHPLPTTKPLQMLTPMSVYTDQQEVGGCPQPLRPQHQCYEASWAAAWVGVAFFCFGRGRFCSRGCSPRNSIITHKTCTRYCDKGRAVHPHGGLSECLFFFDTFVGGFPSLHLFALHLRRTVLGLRLKRIEREFVIKDDGKRREGTRYSSRRMGG